MSSSYRTRFQLIWPYVLQLKHIWLRVESSSSANVSPDERMWFWCFLLCSAPRSPDSEGIRKPAVDATHTRGEPLVLLLPPALLLQCCLSQAAVTRFCVIKQKSTALLFCWIAGCDLKLLLTSWRTSTPHIVGPLCDGDKRARRLGDVLPWNYDIYTQS